AAVQDASRDLWRRVPPLRFGLRLSTAAFSSSIAYVSITALVFLAAHVKAQPTNDLEPRIKAVEERLSYLEARLARQIDELYWAAKLEPIAQVEKLSFAGPAPHNSNAAPGSNMVVISAMTFMPKKTP